MEELLYNKYRMELSDTQFRLSTDTMVLADFARISPRSRVLDLGCGCGALGLLLLGGDESLDVTGLELQAEAAQTAEKNAVQNGLGERLHILNGDLRNYRALLRNGQFDAVISNPPYYPAGAGKVCQAPALAAARTELFCTPDDLCRCAAWALRWGGSFFLVHKPERLVDLFCSLRQTGLEPKRLQYVRHRPDRPVSLVLIEARLGGKSGLKTEPDLLLSKPDGSPTEAYDRIYHREDTI